jgi:hypothetical protein
LARFQVSCAGKVSIEHPNQRYPPRLATLLEIVIEEFAVAPLVATKTIVIKTGPLVDGFQEQDATSEPFVGRFLQPGIIFPRS